MYSLTQILVLLFWKHVYNYFRILTPTNVGYWNTDKTKNAFELTVTRHPRVRANLWYITIIVYIYSIDATVLFVGIPTNSPSGEHGKFPSKSAVKQLTDLHTHMCQVRMGIRVTNPFRFVTHVRYWMAIWLQHKLVSSTRISHATSI